MRRLSAVPFLVLRRLLLHACSRADHRHCHQRHRNGQHRSRRLPHATVTITNPATGTAKTALTGSSGEYNINYLIPGSYTISVTSPGFTTYQSKGIVLEINQQAKINPALTPGGANDVVEVRTTQPLLNADNATLGAVIGPEQAANLPLNGRKFNDLAVLTPGVTVADPDNHSSFDRRFDRVFQRQPEHLGPGLP